jgi:hypothetical protein
MTDEAATRLAALIAEHQADGCYCPACAEAMADLSMDGRDHAGRRIERVST